MKIAEMIKVTETYQHMGVSKEMADKLRAMQELMSEIKEYLEFAKIVSGNHGEVAYSIGIIKVIAKIGAWENE